MTVKCEICGLPAAPFAVATVLDKYQVQYFFCGSCGFVQTETPFWLDEAYAEAITTSDIGYVSRNVQTAVITRAVLRTRFDAQGKFVDFGGGWGMFVRLMRDTGYDFYRIDRYAENLFAQGFDAPDGFAGPYELLTAFEVFEHLVNPREEIGEMFRLSKSILFSTRLISTPPPTPDEWWYYGCEHGQHVSLFSRRTLEKIAQDFQVNLISDGHSLHLFTPKKIPSWMFWLTTRYRLGQLWDIVVPRRSLRSHDYRALAGRELE